jgi:CRISPR system Cascade subunit CasD
MSTLVARLAGPLQAWGAEPRLRTAGTHPTPTWSGLLGLARAALGHGRTDPTEQIRWLRNLDMAVRIDQPGTIHVDYHTINPLPFEYCCFTGKPNDRAQVTKGDGGTWTMPKDSSDPRPPEYRIPTLPTRRHLIHDAAFLWLVQGPEDDLERLANALTNPRWVLALGRKSCTPASPVLLGLHPATLAQAAQIVPLTGRVPRWNDNNTDPRTKVQLVWIHGTPDPTFTTTGTRVVLDNPLGSHPQDGYAAGRPTTCSRGRPRTSPTPLGPSLWR